MQDKQIKKNKEEKIGITKSPNERKNNYHCNYYYNNNKTINKNNTINKWSESIESKQI